MRDALRASGLLLDARAQWAGGLAIACLGVTAYAGILWLIAALGGNPSGLAFWGFAVMVTSVVHFIRRRHRTQRGDAVLQRLQQDFVALKESGEHAPALLAPADLARAVAIYGPEILQGGTLKTLVRRSSARKRAAGLVVGVADVAVAAGVGAGDGAARSWNRLATGAGARNRAARIARLCRSDSGERWT